MIKRHEPHILSHTNLIHLEYLVGIRQEQIRNLQAYAQNVSGTMKTFYLLVLVHEEFESGVLP